MVRLINKTSSAALIGLICCAVCPRDASAQDGRPDPASARPVRMIEGDEDRPGAAGPRPRVSIGTNGRRDSSDSDEMVQLGLNNVSVEQLMQFIVEATGKSVLPSSTTATTALMQKKITVLRENPVPRHRALDIIFAAMRNNGVGIIEHEDYIILALQTEINSYPPPFLGPDDSVMLRYDLGGTVVKVYRVENTDAVALSEKVQGIVPDDVEVLVDENSNQIMLKSTVEVCQQVQRLIDTLDYVFVKVKTETFRLAHADATEVAENIMELFEQTSTPGSGRSTSSANRTRLTPAQRQRLRDAQQRAGSSAGTATVSEITPGPVVELRVAVNALQNSVTVQADPGLIETIRELIEQEWDLPRPETTQKVYFLKYTDPVKMRDMLHELLGQPGGGGVGGGGGARRPGVTSGGGTDVAEAIGGIYRIEAYEDSNSLVVISKTVEAFAFLDSLIDDLDQPIFPGLPMVIELKHADAEEVADQVNVILAPAGARVDLMRREQGLQGIDIGGADGGVTGGGGATGGATGNQQPAGAMSFPWQQGRPDQDTTAESALIGKVRVVPIHRQNAVMILAAPEYRESVRELIVDVLDKPGRQVMISAIIAEVEWTDDLAFGVRFSNSTLGGPLIDNRIGGNVDFEGTEDNLFGIFDTSVLNVNVSLNVLLQALSQKTKVRILQQPVVFTADNQEASFFEGQDVPVLATTQNTPQGGTVETTNYEQVGIGLNVRPRITTEGDVDMEINLEISNIVPGQVQFNSPVFDRRETTTQIIIRDGQTIVLSGILRDLESQIRRKIPILGDIPFVGEAFKSTEKTTTTAELLMFITPIVVENPSDNDRNYNERARERLRDLQKPIDEQRPPDRNIGRRLLDESARPEAYEPR